MRAELIKRPSTSPICSLKTSATSVTECKGIERLALFTAVLSLVSVFHRLARLAWTRTSVHHSSGAAKCSHRPSIERSWLLMMMLCGNVAHAAVTQPVELALPPARGIADDSRVPTDEVAPVEAMRRRAPTPDRRVIVDTPSLSAASPLTPSVPSALSDSMHDDSCHGICSFPSNGGRS